jgi:hypothetical protein
MTTVKLLIDFGSRAAGDVVELKDHSAKAFIERRWAIAFKTPEKAIPVKAKAKK